MIVMAKDRNQIDIEKLNSTDAKVKYAFAKEIVKIAAETPELIFEHYDDLMLHLSNKSDVIKWTAIDLIGYLSSADYSDKTEKMLPVLYDFVHGKSMITSNHAIFALGLIARNQPKFRPEVLQALLEVMNNEYKTADCKAIVMGNAIDVLKDFLDEVKLMPQAEEFARAAQECEREATRKKADSFMKKLKK